MGEVHRLSLGDLYLQPTPGSLPRLWLTGKRGAQRVAYLSPQALVALKNWLAVRPDVRTQAVFLSRLHRRISVRTIQDRLTRYCHRAGVDLSCHRLRHTFATQLLNAGCQVTSIQKLLGHKQLRSTMIYARVHDHTVAEHYYAAMATIEGHLDPVARSGQSDNVEQGQTLATRLDSAGEPMSIDEPARLLALIDRLAEPQLEPGARLALVEQMRGVLNYDQDLATTGNPIKMAIDTAA